MSDTEKQLQFKLVNIQVVSKTMEALPQEFNIVENGFRYEVKVEDKVQAVNELVLVFVRVKISNNDMSTLYATLNVVYFFHIIEFTNHIVLENDGRYTIPPDFDAIVRPVCISTTRGIVYSEFRGTHLHSAFMPVIMMTDMKPDELKKEKNYIDEFGVEVDPSR